MRLVASANGSAGMPAEPVIPVAFLGRTSTLEMQDPVASMRRQVRTCQDALPDGCQIVASYWDIESGGLDLDQRGRSNAWRQFPDIGIPRDGGLQDLLADAAGDTPQFAAVICAEIERAGRDFLASLQLEKKLAASGTPIFAADEPISIEGVSESALLVRRTRQGYAEFFRYQIKKNTWGGLVQHSIDGWNIGKAGYGYLAERVPHPIPLKASQGRTKTRLILDPNRAPIVAQMFTWRTIDKLGQPAIAERLNTAGIPAPDGAAGWTAQTVAAILANPKYTGHMVYGRRRLRNGRRRRVPPAQWFWSPQPVHPVIVDRVIWEAAQHIGAEHATSRDGTGLNTHPATTRFYPYRSHVLCKDCQRRMSGCPKGRRKEFIYYRCPHDPANPRHATASPAHPRTVQAPETRLDQLAGDFFARYAFGPERAALLAAQLPATDADATAARDAAKADLNAKLKRNGTALDAQIIAQEQLPADPADDTANEMRARIRARCAELTAERQQLKAQLDALDATTPQAADTSLLDELPFAGNILPDLPPRLKARLFQAFNLTILWNKPGNQATVWVEITDATLQALPAILNPRQDGYHDTAPDQPEPVGDLDNPPITGPMFHRSG
jgi:hypothetical protein